MSTERVRRLVSLRSIVFALLFVGVPLHKSVAHTSWPAAPPAQIWGNTTLLSRPAEPPPGAIVPAGNNAASTGTSPARRSVIGRFTLIVSQNFHRVPKMFEDSLSAVLS